VASRRRRRRRQPLDDTLAKYNIFGVCTILLELFIFFVRTIRRISRLRVWTCAFFRLAQTLHRIGTDSRVRRHRRRRRRAVLPWFTKYPYHRRRRRELLLPLHKLEGDCNRARTHAKTHARARNTLDTHSLARAR